VRKTANHKNGSLLEKWSHSSLEYDSCCVIRVKVNLKRKILSFPIKTAVTEAKEDILVRKQDACIAKLDEGIELIDGRQKLILMADRSDGWRVPRQRNSR